MPVIPSPISATLRSMRMLRWAHALREAFDERPGIELDDLLAHVERVLRRETARNGDTEAVTAALHDAFPIGHLTSEVARQDILSAVEGGDMRPSAAERWARIFGWPQFAGWADPAKFDPMAEEFWTLPMTAAWIRWHKLDRSGQAYIDNETDEDAAKDYWRKRDYARVIEHVRRHWSAYIAQSTRWVEVEHPFLIGDEDDPSANEDAACRALDRGRCGYIVAPREDRGWSEFPGETTETAHILREALKSKILQAECYYDRAFKLIPGDEWSALKIVDFHDGDGVHRVFAPDGTEYLAVRIPRKQVMMAFPFSMADQESGAAIQAIAATAENVKAELQREANERGGNILGQKRALAHIKARGFAGHDLQGTVRSAVRELSGGRGPGER